MFDGEVDQAAGTGDPFIVDNFEFRFGERRGHLIFDDFQFCQIAGDGAVTGFDLADAADVDADGGVEFQGATAGGGFRATEHDADFFTNLVGENDAGPGFGDEAG